MTAVRTRPALGNDLARAIVDAALAAARETELRFAIAVVDESGHLSAFARMDGSGLMTIQIAQDKAYTAAAFGLSTTDWHEFVENDAQLAPGARTGIDRLVTFGGGLPIVVEGQLVGGIGVSGGHWSDDVKIAEAGLTAITAVTAVTAG
ncbi:GlcG/HbpS family heme-binding protein [Streptomyces vinaceus]|uniref:GlcG/HbpS family heme-binding protein n=1 Tax=Streptomyces vinaceus TaxID=1960 RepID=UPI003830ACE4